MNRLPFAALWLLVFSIPWANMLVLDSSGTVSRAFGIAAFALGALHVAATGRIRRLRLPHLVLAAFVAWASWGFFWSQSPELTLGRAWTYLQLAAMVWLIWQFARTRAQQRALLQAFVLGSYVAIAGTLANYVTGQQVNYLRYAASGFGPNDLGVILALGIPMGWYLSLTDTRRAWVWLNRLYVPLAALAVMLTASRTAFAAALVALLIVPWTLTRLSPRSRALVLAGAAVCVAVVYVVVPASSWARISTIPSSVAEKSFSSREDIWEAGQAVFAAHPLQGVGAGAFREAVAPALGEQAVAHNTFLSILAENGLVGFALFGVIAILCLAGVLKMPTPERRLWIVLIATWTVGAFFLSWEHRHPTWLLLGLLLTQAFAVSSAASRPAQWSAKVLVPDAE